MTQLQDDILELQKSRELQEEGEAAAGGSEQQLELKRLSAEVRSYAELSCAVV